MLYSLYFLAAAITQTSENSRYEDCVSLVAEDIEKGRAAAQEWTFQGGGADAQHCLAVADIAAGYNKLAAARLESIAERKDAGDDFIRARLLAQAAQAWLEADEIVAAERTIKAAFALVPDSGELHLTAAKIHARNERWNQVIAAVDTAAQAGFETAEAYVLRGRANFGVGNYEAAANDVVSALTLDPVNIDALTLRGDIQQTGVVIDVYYDDADAKE